MNFNKLARKINKQVELLQSEGCTEDHEVFNRMAAFLPEIGQLWNETSDRELLSLMNSYPYFKKYCLVVETLYEKEQMKEHRVYDGLSQFNQEDSIISKAIFADASQLESELAECISTSVVINIEDRERLKRDVASWVKRKQDFLDSLREGGNLEHEDIMNQIFVPIEERLENGIERLTKE